MTQESRTEKTDSTMNTINHWVRKGAWWLVGLVITAAGGVYSHTMQRIDALDSRVAYLAQEKVSREELRQVTSELKKQIDGTKYDIIAQQDKMKLDILSRLDFMLKIIPNNTNNKN